GAGVVVAVGDQPTEVVIEGAIFLHDHEHVLDRDVAADAQLLADGLGRQRARPERARGALGRQLAFGLGADRTLAGTASQAGDDPNGDGASGARFDPHLRASYGAGSPAPLEST